MDVYDDRQWVVDRDRAIGQNADRLCAKCTLDVDLVGGERGELERDPQRQSDELRLLCQGGGSADAPQRGRRIVNVASVRSVVAGDGNLQYDTTKAAVAGLTRALAADHSPEGIRVNAVGPGPIFTPFHQRRIAAAGETVE
jgi:NAD(P)-dependent dehydrogenase (short-subunit alcohol dehydrogenase family)